MVTYSKQNPVLLCNEMYVIGVLGQIWVTWMVTVMKMMMMMVVYQMMNSMLFPENPLHYYEFLLCPAHTSINIHVPKCAIICQWCLFCIQIQLGPLCKYQRDVDLLSLPFSFLFLMHLHYLKVYVYFFISCPSSGPFFHPVIHTAMFIVVTLFVERKTCNVS